MRHGTNWPVCCGCARTGYFERMGPEKRGGWAKHGLIKHGRLSGSTKPEIGGGERERERER